MRFKNYLMTEASKKFVPDEANLYSLVNVSGVKDLKAGTFRFYGKTNGKADYFVSSGEIYEFAIMNGLGGATRAEGKHFKISIAKKDFGSVILQSKSYNNADLLEDSVVMAINYLSQTGKTIPVEELIRQVDNHPNKRYTDGFKNKVYIYSTNNIKQIQSLMTNGKYTFELQGKGGHNHKLYELQSRYLKLNKDIWNPADIWGFTQKGLSALSKIDTFIDEWVEDNKWNTQLFEADVNPRGQALNYFINLGMKTKDILPVSLKAPENGSSMKVYTINVFDPRSVPSYDLSDIKLTKFTPGSDSFRSLEIQTNHKLNLKVKFQCTGDKNKACGFQHRVRNEKGKHAEGAYMTHPEWKTYFKSLGLEIHSCDRGNGIYKAFPTSYDEMKKLFMRAHKNLKSNPQYDNKILNKIGDPDEYFDNHFNSNPKDNINFIKRFIFIGETVTVYSQNPGMLKKAISLAIKYVSTVDTTAPHFVIK